MKIGQMSLAKVSTLADYVQLDISGLIVDEAVQKAEKYKGKDIILHGDWEKKKGQSENNIVIRTPEYLKIITALSKTFNIIGFTIHPPKKTRVTWNDFLCCLEQINNKVPVFVENRSNIKLYCSKPEEFVDLSYNFSFFLTLDIPQFFIACQYNHNIFLEKLNQLNWENIKEIHLANIKKDGSHTYVGRKLNDPDGLLNLSQILSYIKQVPNITLEILGGVPTFNSMYSILI